MNDLIWIGNSLYPRWVVFLAAGLLALVIVTVVVFAISE